MAGQPPGPAHDGSSIVMDAETGVGTTERRRSLRMGTSSTRTSSRLELSKWVFLSSEDDFRPGPLYLYKATSDAV